MTEIAIKVKNLNQCYHSNDSVRDLKALQISLELLGYYHRLFTFCASINRVKPV
jgi:hypothetical protein